MTKQMHQRLAMTNAKRVACCRGSEKEKARRDCLNHLRASLFSAATESVLNTKRESV